MTDLSATSPAAAASPPAKEFRCTWGSCTKSFSRAEHLHRHALNHSEGNGTTCERCSAVFKRKDLLDRHMARHKEKDEEAGGEGLGKLLTRKRLWRDSTGAIIADRRPEHEKKRKRPSTSNDTSSSHKPNDSSATPPNQAGAPLSPPISDPTGSEANGTSGNAVSVSPDDQWPMPIEDTILPLEDTIMDSFDFLCNASWGSQPLQAQSGQGSMITDLPYDDIFVPDTASSFNMPFTTMSYYNWLFGNESWPGATFDANIGHGISSRTGPAPHVSNIGSLLSGFEDSYRGGVPQNSQGSAFRSGVLTSDYSSDFNRSEKPDQAVSKSAELLLMLQSGQSHPDRSLTPFHSGSTSDESSTQSQGFKSTNTRFQEIRQSVRSNQDTKSNSGQSKPTRRLPAIDEIAREAVLSLIDQARPKSSDGTDITRDHQLLSESVLQNWCDLFFSRFNVSYPLLHQATFDPARIDPLLLTSVLLLGATYSTKEDHLFSICIHNTMRTQILGSKSFTTRPTLWILQTILLVECFGKSRAGQLQHDMSHLFHGLLINLIRRSDCQTARCRTFSEAEVNPDQRWRAEVDAEQKRRLALLCFMWDTQHAVLFSQSLCMNAAELKLSLPWDRKLWEADTAEEWHSVNSTVHPAPQYLSILKTYINTGTRSRTPLLNGLSRVLMLHGLMSVAWDLNRRDQTSLGIAITGNEESWQSRMARSYDSWKADFDNYGKERCLTLDEGSAERDEFQRFFTANLAIYHSAHIILHVEIIDLQIYAGASHIIGRPVMKTDQERSRQRIERWARKGSISAEKAASHSARILRDGIRKLKHWNAGDVFHYPWCLYLATLTIWAFQTASKAGAGSDNEDNGDSDDEDADWDSRAEMNALVSAMTRSNLEDLWRVAAKYRTSDLPKVMAKHLSTIRWAVVQEGMIVLRGLIGRKRVT